MLTVTDSMVTHVRQLRPDCPLSPVSARFTLSVSSATPPLSDAVRSSPATRPFGLRFAAVRDSHPATPHAVFRFCDELQVAVTSDEAGGAPIHEQIAGWTHTTIASKDGQTPGQEEWKMDPTFADES